MQTTTNTATSVTTPSGIDYFRYASLKGQLKLESLGLKSSAGALRPLLAKEFGLKPRAPHADYIAFCVKQMEALLATR